MIPEEMCKLPEIPRRKKWIKYLKRVITVEPAILLYVTATFICDPTLRKLKQEKACRSNLGLNETACEEILSQPLDINNTIFYITESVPLWQKNVETFVPLILVIFIGPFSDEYNLRKPFLVLPMLGEIVGVIGCILSVVFMEEWSVEVFRMFQTTIPALFGGIPLIFIMMYAYVADVSTVEERTFRIGVAYMFNHVSIILSYLWDHSLLDYLGYYGVLALTGMFFIFIILYVIFWLEELTPSKIVWNRYFVVEAINPKHVVKGAKLLLTKNPTNNIHLLLMTLFIAIVSGVVYQGEINILPYYLYIFFSMGEEELHSFNNLTLQVTSVGILLGLLLFTKILKLDDSIFLILVFLNRIISNVTFALANTASQINNACYTEILGGLTFPVIRSMATKFVSYKNFAKVQVLFYFWDTLETLIVPHTNEMYELIFMSTIRTSPSAFFFVGIVLFAFCIPLLLWMYFKNNTFRVLWKGWW